MGEKDRAALPTLVYVASARSNEIAAFVLDADDGRLEPVGRVALPPGVTPLAVDPQRRYLYAGLRGEAPAAVTLHIDPQTGGLTPVGRTPLADPPMYLGLDAGGNLLLSASYANATFTVSAIRAGGLIDPTPTEHIATPPHPHSVLTDPSNRYLFVAALGADAILQYAFDAGSGRVTPNAVPFIETPDGSGPRHMVFHPHDSVLYVNGELDGSICSYELSRETGRLTALDRALILPESSAAVPWAAELAIGPDGRYLYASERRTSTLAIFDLGGGRGALRRNETVAVEEQPRSFAIDSRGRFLVLAGEVSQHVSVYRIDPSSGSLDARGRYAVAEKPCWVTIVDLAQAFTTPKAR